MAAKYLVRFDDVCPTMNWKVWEQVESVLISEDIKPILSVVPDNRDPNLKVAPTQADFWGRVRGWASRGWDIAVHGYQHRYVTCERGLIGLQPYSEFAGLPVGEQEYKLQRAMEVFRRERVHPELWVAPAHSMDQATVEALRTIGIRQISDGFACLPHVDPQGTLWIPQQLWRFRSMPWGTWTVCLHPNDWTSKQVERFRRDVTDFRSRIVTLSDVVRTYQFRSRRPVEDTLESCYLLAIRCRMLFHSLIHERWRPVSSADGHTTMVRPSNSL